MKKIFVTVLIFIFSFILLCSIGYAIDENSGIKDIQEYFDSGMGGHSNMSYSDLHKINADLADYLTAHPGTLLWSTNGYKENYLLLSESEWTINEWYPQEYAHHVAFSIMLYEEFCPQSRILVLYDGNTYIKLPHIENSEFDDILSEIYSFSFNKRLNYY